MTKNFKYSNSSLVIASIDCDISLWPYLQHLISSVCVLLWNVFSAPIPLIHDNFSLLGDNKSNFKPYFWHGSHLAIWSLISIQYFSIGKCRYDYAFSWPSLYCRWSAGTLRRTKLGRRSSPVKPMCLCSCSTPRPWTSACQATSPGATPSSLRWWLRPLWTATRETVCKCRAGEILFNQNLKEQLLLKRKKYWFYWQDFICLSILLLAVASYRPHTLCKKNTVKLVTIKCLVCFLIPGLCISIERPHISSRLPAIYFYSARIFHFSDNGGDKWANVTEQIYCTVQKFFSTSFRYWAFSFESTTFQREILYNSLNSIYMIDIVTNDFVRKYLLEILHAGFSHLMEWISPVLLLFK